MEPDQTDRNVTINKELLVLAATASGGYTRQQLEALGVGWPPQKGWKRRAVGRKISMSRFDVLMSEAAHGLRRRTGP
jgi:hypothetical protein